MIRECLCRDLLDPDTSNPSIVSSLLHALCRNPDQGPYGELISIFNSVPWSYVRSDVARTMAATDPAFAEETAPGCLGLRARAPHVCRDARRDRSLGCPSAT